MTAFEHLLFEGSDTPPSTHSSQSFQGADSVLIRKIFHVVEPFLKDHLPCHIDLMTLQEHAQKISAFLAQSVANREPEPEMSCCITEQLKQFLPKRTLRYIRPTDFARLIFDVLTLVRDNQDEEEGFTFDELLDSIIAEQSKEPVLDSNEFLLTCFQNIFSVLSVQDAIRPEHLEEYVSLLRKVPDLKPVQIDGRKLAIDVISHLRQHTNDFDEGTVKAFIENLTQTLVVRFKTQ